MKSNFLYTITLLLTLSTTMAQTKTEYFNVKGSCNMCEKRIEKAAKSVKGVAYAKWDIATRTIEIRFDDTKTTIDKIHKAIAKAGHDTDKEKAENTVYNRLPACCKYDRSETEYGK